MGPAMPIPSVGTEAPDFNLPTDQGGEIRLSDLRGRRVVLFFYPRADTPGCIKESCGFRDDYQQFQKHDIVVLGISPDTVEDQAAFSRRYGFPYPLLADADHAVAEAYGVWQEIPWRGGTVLGAARTTFVIDQHGRISQVFEGVDPRGHSREILQALGVVEPSHPAC